jgi:hypothetical protein
MKTAILVYYDGGETCLNDVTDSRKNIIKTAKDNEQTCYLSGFRYWDNDSQSVMVFFTSPPTTTEIEKRRSNGLKGAKLHRIN